MGAYAIRPMGTDGGGLFLFVHGDVGETGEVFGESIHVFVVELKDLIHGGGALEFDGTEACAGVSIDRVIEASGNRRKHNASSGGGIDNDPSAFGVGEVDLVEGGAFGCSVGKGTGCGVKLRGGGKFGERADGEAGGCFVEELDITRDQQGWFGFTDGQSECEGQGHEATGAQHARRFGMAELEGFSIFSFTDGDTEGSETIAGEQHTEQADRVEFSGLAVEIKRGVGACVDREAFVELFVDGEVAGGELAEIGDQVVGFAVFVFVVSVGDFGKDFDIETRFETECHFFKEGFDGDEKFADIETFAAGDLGDQGGHVTDFEFGSKGKREAIFTGIALGLEFRFSTAEGFEDDTAWDGELLTKNVDFKAFAKERIEVQAKDIRGDGEAGETNRDVVGSPLIFGNAHDTAINIKVHFSFDTASFGVVGLFDELDEKIIFVDAESREEGVIFVEDVDICGEGCGIHGGSALCVGGGFCGADHHFGSIHKLAIGVDEDHAEFSGFHSGKVAQFDRSRRFALDLCSDLGFAVFGTAGGNAFCVDGSDICGGRFPCEGEVTCEASARLVEGDGFKLAGLTGANNTGRCNDQDAIDRNVDDRAIFFAIGFGFAVLAGRTFGVVCAIIACGFAAVIDALLLIACGAICIFGTFGLGAFSTFAQQTLNALFGFGASAAFSNGVFFDVAAAVSGGFGGFFRGGRGGATCGNKGQTGHKEQSQKQGYEAAKPRHVLLTIHQDLLLHKK